ncbi:MAG: beta-galactosidase [Firmicutes bacterium]|nr:beta-galactosidase [Bacillota bacterium]
MLEIRGEHFYLNGEKFQIRAGAIHYFRTLPEYWEDRLRKLKLAGFNTVETYVCWNLHEPQQGVFDFSGMLDIERFLNTAQQLGLYAIVRPSPYICAEWDFGGLPAWLLREPELHVRCAEEPYLSCVADFYRELLPRLAAHQLDRGGNILMMQVENEYGSFGNDKEYLRALERMMRENGITVPLFTSDGPDDGMLTGGTLPELLKVVNFGSRTGEAFEKLREFDPGKPLMCGEFWNGWFDHWGEQHHTQKVENVEAELKTFLELHASFSFYMFHGGTNFGFTAGANHDSGYEPTVTSYDDDALLTEWGDYTPKYHAVRRMLHEAAGLVPEPLPDSPALQNIGSVRLTQSASLLEQAERIGELHKAVSPRTMEQLGQNSGMILYRTRLAGAYRSNTLFIDGLHDRAHVFLDGRLLGVIYRNDSSPSVQLPPVPRQGATLEILVEAMGRVNYGPRLIDRKGITGCVRLGNQQFSHWEICTMPLNNLEKLQFTDGISAQKPAVLRGTFAASSQADCFVHPDGFTKGIVFVNGFNLGRYWNIGPQKSLYLPGVLLKEENEILVLELDGTESDTVTITDRHELG